MLLVLGCFFAHMGQAMAQVNPTPPYVYESEHLSDGTFMRHWLLCGPFPNPTDEAAGGICLHDHTCAGFFTDYLAPIGGEIGCVPQDRLEVPAPDDVYRRWNAVSALGDRIYFDDYLTPSNYQTGYAVCWIDAASATDRLIGVGSNDGIRIWVNGSEVFRYHAERLITPDDHYLRLPLRAGRNQILVKLDNGEGRWGFMMRPVANEAAMAELVNRLPSVLRFDYRVTDTAFELTLGDPTRIGNIEDLPPATITLLNRAGERVASIESPLCQPVLLPFADYPDTNYTLEGKVLWPRRGRVVTPGMLYRGDLRSEVQALLSAPVPAMPDCRPADAYRDLVASVAHLDRINGFAGEPYAYDRLKTGLTQALESALVIQNSPSPFDHVFPTPRQFGTSSNETVFITGNWTLDVAASIFDESLDSAMFVRWSGLTGALGGDAVGRVRVFALESGVLGTPTAELAGDDAEYRDAARAIEEFVPREQEGYAIQLAAGGVTIAGRTAAGAFYGMDTFLQLLAQAPAMEDNTLALDAGLIIDAPLYATRAAVQPLESMDGAFQAHIDQLAALRFNTVFLPSTLYADLDDSEIQPLLISAYAYCRSRFVEPIPLVETFGAETLAAKIEPSLWEGVYMEELPVEVDNLRRLFLPYDRILETAGTHPRLRTGEGYKILRKDRDYVIASYAPPIIQLTGQAPVQTGETILVTADLVDGSLASTRASCPSDSASWLITEQVIERIYTHLKPKGLHLGNTGVGYLNRDSRCLERESPNALILADAVQKGFDIVRKQDRKSEVFIWGDHFNPMQRALALDALQAPQSLPKDITVLDWHYHSDSYYDVWRVAQGIRYFDQFGLDTMGVVQGDPLNVAQFAAMKRTYPRRFRGIVHRPDTPEDSGAYAAAQAGWQGTTLMGSGDS